MPEFHVHAAWTLAAAFAISLVYELYRATVKAGTSKHDTMREFLTIGLGLYTVAGVIIACLFLFREAAWPVWLGLALSVGMILVSIFYYNPKVMLERHPGLIDWAEDLVFTGLLFVAAAQLGYALLPGG